MAEPEFLQNPMDLVAQVLGVALNPAASPTERSAACERLRHLSPQFLHSLALDPDWRFVLGVLAQEPPAGDLPGDGPWSETQRPRVDGPARDAAPGADAGGALPPGSPVVLRPLLALYVRDITQMIQQDFALNASDLGQLPPMLAETPRFAETPLTDRAYRSIAVASRAPEPVDAYVRALPWSLVNHAMAFDTIGRWWPGRHDLLAAFLSEVLQHHADMGVPPILAQGILRAVAGRPARATWLDSVGRWVDETLDREWMPVAGDDYLGSLHFHLRVGVAQQVRCAEIVDPKLIGVAEIYAMVRLLRRASSEDLSLALADGGGDISQALTHFRRRSQFGEMQFERTLKAALRQPTAALADQLTSQQRQALRLVRHLYRMDPLINTRGLLTAPAGP